MLSYLHVKNFALINELNLDFHSGLSVLTGETGAGKSILIGSMNAIAGAKLDKSIIRAGSEYALVEMIFHIDDSYILELSTKYDIIFDDEGALIVSRRFNKSGRSVYRVNGEIATSSLVKEITEHMIDIHSQHDHQSLLRPNQHIHMLDRYIGDDIALLKDALKADYSKYRSFVKQISEEGLDDEHRRREMDFLRFEIEEIEESAIVPDEDIQLQNEYKILSNKKKIVDKLSHALFLIDENPEGSMDQLLDALLNDINTVSQYDKSLSDVYAEARQIEDLFSGLKRTVLKHLSEIEMDNGSLSEIEQRLHVINSLKSKYGENLEDIIALGVQKQKELEFLENYEENRKKIKEKINTIESKILELCGDISAMRQSAATHIAKEIEVILAELNFNDSRVKIEVSQKDGFDSMGYDQVTIMISTNKNEEVQPLNKIASGGELSRVMLALKSVFARMDQIGTLVFDEIDTGISGRTAQKVAEKMATLSKHNQLICITHLPQIAAMGDHHYYIEKNEINDRIESNVKVLEDKKIYMELARLIGGATITENTMSSAKEMKEQAILLKDRL